MVEGDLSEIGAKLGEKIMELVKPAIAEHVVRLQKEADKHAKDAENATAAADNFKSVFGEQLKS